MIASIDEMMTEGKATTSFWWIYRNRQPGQTVPDLYLQIIEGFEKKN